MKKKLIALLMMILLVLTFGTRNATADDTEESETRASSTIELTFVIFNYEEGQEAWIPNLVECPVPEPYSGYSGSYYAGKLTLEKTNEEEMIIYLAVDENQDNCYGVISTDQQDNRYSCSILRNLIFYKTASDTTEPITIEFVKMPLLDFGENHKDLLKRYEGTNTFLIFKERYMKLNYIGVLTANAMYDYVFKEIINMCGEMDEAGNKYLADNNEYLMSLSRNSADADIEAIENEAYRYQGVDNDYTRVAEGDRFYLVWYQYKPADENAPTWNQDSAEGLDITFKRDRDDAGVDYSKPANAYYNQSVNPFKMEGYKQPGSTYDEFDHAEVDGSKVDVTTASGSVIVTLAPEVLNELELGEHTLTAYFKDGLKVSKTFTILEAAEPEPEPTPTPTPTPTPEPTPAKTTTTETTYKLPVTGVE